MQANISDWHDGTVSTEFVANLFTQGRYEHDYYGKSGLTIGQFFKNNPSTKALVVCVKRIEQY